MLKYRMLKVKNVGKPDEGKLHVRFDEEGQVRPALYSITGRKKAVANESLFLVDRQITMDGGGIQEPGGMKEGPGTLVPRRLFGSFWSPQKELAVGTVDQQNHNNRSLAIISSRWEAFSCPPT